MITARGTWRRSVSDRGIEPYFSARRLRCGSPVTNDFDAALVMTHVADTDLEALRALALTDVPYVGLLGPPARRDELLALLEPDERVALRSRLHAPVGLPLGGEGPEAIALAIAAQLQQTFNAQR